ncbi:MAG: M28 family peptidase [Saprospiraceae bacterium]
MKKILLLSSAFFCVSLVYSQTNIKSTSVTADQVMKGKYDPSNYYSASAIRDPKAIVKAFANQMSADSLHKSLDKLATFYTRNSASDTLSETRGIGAARRWAYREFEKISAQNNNRLISSYLQFDHTQMCGVIRHRNIFAVLPGADTTDKSIVIVEGHIDSRCKDVCDTTCLAQGIEDNGSGTALVLELARVMSKCEFKRTIVFLLTTGEEQGTYGAEAFASYVRQNGIPLRAVLNNDISGGIFCGYTSSAPSCPGYGNIDSTNVRLFSAGGFNSPHKQFAQFVKLEYLEETKPLMDVATNILIMSAEDRTGRGSDHIPFRQKNYTAIRMTAANENGSANVADPNYKDRQHTSKDILGLNTNSDPDLDSFFVDFNYLKRNTIINATAVGMAAIGPQIPDLTAIGMGKNSVIVNIVKQTDYKKYRIAVRSKTNDWDSVYTISGKLQDTLNFATSGNRYFSVASVDDNGIESLFSKEVVVNVTTAINDLTANKRSTYITANTPNPSDEQTLITIFSEKDLSNKSSYLSITDLTGKEVHFMPVTLNANTNEILYNHGFHASGIYICTLIVDGKKVDAVKLIFN